MTLTETLNAAVAHQFAAQAAVDAANAELTAANQAVVDAQAAIGSVQPHLDIIAQIESELIALEQGVAVETAAALENVKAVIEPLLVQLRSVFNV